MKYKQILFDIGVLLIAFVIGYTVCHFVELGEPVQPTKLQSTEVESYVIEQSKQKVDSMAKLLTIHIKTIDSLNQKKHEKIIIHKPLPRPIVTDSSRKRNIDRFY